MHDKNVHKITQKTKIHKVCGRGGEWGCVRVVRGFPDKEEKGLGKQWQGFTRTGRGEEGGARAALMSLGRE